MMKSTLKTIHTSFIIFILSISSIYADYIIIPMDISQKNHLKAYGIAYWVLDNELEVEWLLNYKGGSFLIKNIEEIKLECTYRGVSFEILSNHDIESIYKFIASPSNNTDVIKLEKAPKIAV